MTTYTFYSDPGHGWLEVDIHEINRLGVRGISSCSYRNGNRCYLEEDRDAPLFLNRKDQLGEKYDIVDKYLDPTPIRDMPDYWNPEG